MKIRPVAFAAAFVAAVLLAGLAAFAQRGLDSGNDQRMGTPRYNPKTEMTVQGTVEKISEVACRSGQTCVQLELKTEKETLRVHLGPSWFLAEKKFAVEPGNPIEVVGSKTTWQGSEILIAREVKKGNETLVLRDAQGYPGWSRGRRR
jgi:hypothetical protein